MLYTQGDGDGDDSGSGATVAAVCVHLLEHLLRAEPDACGLNCCARDGYLGCAIFMVGGRYSSYRTLVSAFLFSCAGCDLAVDRNSRRGVLRGVPAKETQARRGAERTAQDEGVD